MDTGYTAIIRQDEDWWIGWIEEVPGANAQERTREELVESLTEALKDIAASTVPRHHEIREMMVRKICGDLDVPEP